MNGLKELITSFPVKIPQVSVLRAVLCWAKVKNLEIIIVGIIICRS